MPQEFNEFEYIDYLSKRVMDRATKQLRGFLKGYKDSLAFDASVAKQYIDRIETENRRTLDIRNQFTDLSDILINCTKNKDDIFKRIEQFEMSIQLKFNRLTDTLIELNELKETINVLKRKLSHG